jgi:hypothetical protein
VSFNKQEQAPEGIPAVVMTSKIRYFLEYSTMTGESGDLAPYAGVFVDKCPTDCDWPTAPLGGKHGHYEPNVFSVRTSVNVKRGALVSYDEGKTSAPNSLSEVPMVHVTWKKIDD